MKAELSAPVDLGLVFALDIESGGLEDLLSDTARIRAARRRVILGKLAGKRLAVILSGAGRTAAAEAAEALIDGHRPSLMLTAGFAGALAASLKRYDVLLVRQVMDAAGRAFDLDRSLLPPSIRQTVRGETLLTADEVACRAAEKQALGQQTGAALVDMETIGVVEVCRRRGVGVLALRVVTDTAEDDLPGDLERMLRQRSMAAQFGAALSLVLRRPSRVFDFYQLRENAIVAADRLAQVIKELCAALA